jgi:excisionase family DNA binding protein
MVSAQNRSSIMEPRTVSVPEAGKWLGIGRNAAYEAARRGEIPTIKIGKLLRVPVVALERKLEAVEGRAQ